MNLKSSLINGTIGLTTVFTTILNIREVLDMMFNHVVQFILFIFLSIFILLISNFFLVRFSKKELVPNRDLEEPNSNILNRFRYFFNQNYWIKRALLTTFVVLFIGGFVGLYYFKTSAVYYIVLTDEGLSQKECFKIKAQLESAEKMDKINFQSHSIHLSTTNQLFLKPAYFTSTYYQEAENLINHELKKIDLKNVHVHQSNPFYPSLKKKLQYLKIHPKIANRIAVLLSYFSIN
jgi:hypothetical protein